MNGSIPARAGEPRGREWLADEAKVYPRACGGTSVYAHLEPNVIGLSPRVRGNRPCGSRPACATGSIPARAGEPKSRRVPAILSRVYPRACGGTRTLMPSTRFASGLSPRVRGNPTAVTSIYARERSIPARAGEPYLLTVPDSSHAVYPRACGGTDGHCGGRGAAQGLSPRVRGNPSRVDLLVPLPGSIPARAGEPAGCLRTRMTTGSIPARAGEPPGWRTGHSWTQVYPRACGGNLTRLAQARNNLGSIPARAGEPLPSASPMCMWSVYPRACGGTLDKSIKTRRHYSPTEYR